MVGGVVSRRGESGWRSELETSPTFLCFRGERELWKPFLMLATSRRSFPLLPSLLRATTSAATTATPACVPLLLQHTRALAKKAGGGKGGKGGAAAAAQQDIGDLEATVCGLNILKDGEDPAVKADSEYPEWVFELHKPLPSMEELTKQYEKDGVDAMRPQDVKRLIRLWNRNRIRERAYLYYWPLVPASTRVAPPCLSSC